MARFKLDAEQTDAILELKIYRLARLEILVIRKELEEKRKRARADQRAAQGRGQPLGARPRRARGDQQPVRRQAPHADRQRQRRARVLRRGLHRRRGQRRDRVARRLGEAAEGSEGPVDDPAARGRRGDGGVRRQHARELRVLLELRRRLHQPIIDVPASTGYGEPIQKLFKLKDGEKIVAAMSLDPRVAGNITREEGRRRRAGARRRGDERRLRAALQPRRLRRAEHPRRPPLRAPGGRRRDRQRRAAHRRRDPDRRHARRRAASSARPTR